MILIFTQWVLLKWTSKRLSLWHWESCYVVLDAGRVTLFAEGCRGSLSEVFLNELLSVTLVRKISSGTVDWFVTPFEYVQKLIKKYNLREKGQGQHQTYALGIKEVYMQHSTQESSIFLLIFAHWKVYYFPGCTSFLLYLTHLIFLWLSKLASRKIFPWDIWIMWKHWHN